LILCDIGNCTFSFYFTNTKQNIKYPTSKTLPPLHELKALDGSNEYTAKLCKIYFISVNEQAASKLQKTYGKKHLCNLHKFVATRAAYKNLGIDRLIICSNINNKIIVDAGSAITIDIVKNNSHLGGYIFLGLSHHISSYKNISKKLKAKPNFAKYANKLDKIPTSTQEALHLSLLQSVADMLRKLHKKHKLDIIITGGDGLIISSLFKKHKNIKHKKNLIFKCMRKVIATNKL